MNIKKAADGVTTITVQGAYIRSGEGKNFALLSLKGYAISGATDFCFRIKGNGDKVVVNLTTSDGTEILSTKVRTFAGWSLYKI